MTDMTCLVLQLVPYLTSAPRHFYIVQPPSETERTIPLGSLQSFSLLDLLDFHLKASSLKKIGLFCCCMFVLMSFIDFLHFSVVRFVTRTSTG